MKLSYKFLCLLLGFTCFSLLLSLALARWSFEQGFTEFIINQERERLNQLAVQLVDEYRANGNSWENVELDNASFFSGPPNRKFGPPRRMGPPPRSRSMAANNLDLGPPTALFDNEDNVVTGNVSRDSSAKQVTVDLISDRGRIGTLISYPPPTPNSEIALAFAAQQNHAIIIIGLVSFALAIIIALGITPRILRPFESILAAVKALTARKYDTYLPNERADEFGELMSHINTLSTTLKNNENTKNQWLADISHELRTPLTILSGEIELIKAGIRPLDQKQLHSFDQEVSRLSLLVEDLYQLSLSDIGGLRYHFLSVNLRDAVISQKDTLLSKFIQKGIDIEIADASPILIDADPQRINQLITNLLVNACEYTDAPGKVVITLKDSGPSATLLIEDTPPGIKKGNESLLFEPLFREDASRARRSSGGGLGLSICKQIVNAHQGKIVAEPSKLGGIKITITLPKEQLIKDN